MRPAYVDKSQLRTVLLFNADFDLEDNVLSLPRSTEVENGVKRWCEPTLVSDKKTL